jgi:hypothetical protein
MWCTYFRNDSPDSIVEFELIVEFLNGILISQYKAGKVDKVLILSSLIYKCLFQTMCDIVVSSVIRHPASPLGIYAFYDLDEISKRFMN